MAGRAAGGGAGGGGEEVDEEGGELAGDAVEAVRDDHLARARAFAVKTWIEMDGNGWTDERVACVRMRRKPSATIARARTRIRRQMDRIG